jgi:hypothetical protein
MLVVGIDERPVNVENGNRGVSHAQPLPAIPVPNRTISELLCLVHDHVPERPGAVGGGPPGHGLVVRGLTAGGQFPGVQQVGDALGRFLLSGRRRPIVGEGDPVLAQVSASREGTHAQAGFG